MQQNMPPPNRIFGAQHVTAPPPNRAPTNRAPDPREANEMLADENQRLAENKRRARLAERMRDREDQLAHMANYALGGADGGEQDLALLVRNQQQNLQNGRRLLGIDQQEQARKPQAMQRPPAGEKAQDKPALQVHSDNRREDSVPRFGAIVSNMAGRKEMVKNSRDGVRNVWHGTEGGPQRMQDRNGTFGGFDKSSQCRQSRFAQPASHPGTVVDAVTPGWSQKHGST